MTLDQLRELVEQMKTTPQDVTAEQIATVTALGDNLDTLTEGQLTEILDAVREAGAEARGMNATGQLVKFARALKAVRENVLTAQSDRLAVAADLESELNGLDDDRAPQATDTGETAATDDPGNGGSETGGNEPTPAGQDANADLVAVAASLASVAQQLANAQTPTPAAEPAKVQGRSAGRIGDMAAQNIPGGRDVIEGRVYGGSGAGNPRFTNSFALGEAIHDKLRTVYSDPSYSGRMQIAHVTTDYPDARKMSGNAASNHAKVEALTSRTALTAAGGLCAPPETLYDIDVIGSAARPIRDALPRVQVERGALQYRPHTSAAAAVNGAGVWTLDNDEVSLAPGSGQLS